MLRTGRSCTKLGNPGPRALSRCAQAPVTYFVLLVRIGASSWNVRRRFKDFDVLYNNLCQAYGKAIVPPVPPKQLVKNESAEFLQRRTQLLASFLAGVMADKLLSMSAELCAFLECESGAFEDEAPFHFTFEEPPLFDEHGARLDGGDGACASGVAGAAGGAS